VSSIAGWEIEPAEAVLRADVLAPHAGAFEELARAGDGAGRQAMERALLGRGMAGMVGLKSRIWREITRPTMQRLIRGPAGTLEDLIARGACQLTGEISVSETAPGVVVNPP
jgi:hypothetical protein